MVKKKKGHNTLCKAKGRTCYSCDKKNHLAQYFKSEDIGQLVKYLEISDSSSDFESEVASEEPFAFTCSRITTDVKTEVLKMERTNLRTLIDISLIMLNIFDKNSFEKVTGKN